MLRNWGNFLLMILSPFWFSIIFAIIGFIMTFSSVIGDECQPNYEPCERAADCCSNHCDPYDRCMKSPI
uniref:Uncharacterized protein n=1 Tax=Megaselia scalaris TaxID=36166 RepID=T1GS31_MEGSC